MLDFSITLGISFHVFNLFSRNLHNTKMCYYIIEKITRSVLKTKSVVLVPREFFNKFTIDNIYFKVLINDNRKSLGISKSYYYYILSELKDKQLIMDNAISFKVLIPVIVNEQGLIFDNSLLFVDDEDKILVFIDNKSSLYECSTCPVYAECLYGLKLVSKRMNVKIKEEKNPSELWNLVIREIIDKYVINNFKAIKLN